MDYSIKTIKEIGQNPAVNNRSESWYGKYFIRTISKYFTFIFLKTSITANHITFLSIICGVLGSLFLMIGLPLYFFVGALFFHLGFILDCVDGEVARIKKQQSIKGIYLDTLGHYLVNPLRFIGLTIGLSKIYPSYIYLIIIFGFLASLFSILMRFISEANYIIFGEMLINSRHDFFNHFNQKIGEINKISEINYKTIPIYRMGGILFGPEMFICLLLILSTINLFIDIPSLLLLLLIGYSISYIIVVPIGLFLVYKKQIDKEMIKLLSSMKSLENEKI